MTHIIKTQTERLQSLKNQRLYTVDCLMNRINEMEDFEIKEFLNMKNEYDSEIFYLETHLKAIC